MFANRVSDDSHRPGATEADLKKIRHLMEPGSGSKGRRNGRESVLPSEDTHATSPERALPSSLRFLFVLRGCGYSLEGVLQREISALLAAVGVRSRMRALANPDAQEAVMPPPRYPSDLSDEEWAILEPLLSSAEKRGRPPKWPPRRVADAVFYLLRSGCLWRMLPREYPPWQTVYYHFRK